MQIKYPNLILLTGAGFTKNFNGFLGKEMWSEIFNDQAIQNSPKIRNLLGENFDFEDVYSKVLRGGEIYVFSESEKQIIQTVIEQVYKRLDDSIRNWNFNERNPTGLNTYGLNGDLLNLFIGKEQEKGLFFTLNQDLLMERNNKYRSPGAPHFPEDFYTIPKREFEDRFFVSLYPSDIPQRVERDILNHQGISYIKLHGSYGWKSSNGSNQIVIGKNKEEDIEREPLLKYYFELFKNVIKEGDKKLLVIGYGFRDMHINKILIEGVEKYRLQLYIITTTSPADFRANFEQGGHYYALPLMSGLRGYVPHSLREIFPPDQSKSIYIESIRKMLNE